MKTLLAIAFIVAVLLVLVGCSPPPTIFKIVKVAVPTPCRAEVPEKPQSRFAQLNGQEDVWTMGIALWADYQDSQAYELQLETALQSCIDR